MRQAITLSIMLPFHRYLAITDCYNRRYAIKSYSIISIFPPWEISLGLKKKLSYQGHCVRNYFFCIIIYSDCSTGAIKAKVGAATSEWTRCPLHTCVTNFPPALIFLVQTSASSAPAVSTLARRNQQKSLDKKWSQQLMFLVS